VLFTAWMKLHAGDEMHVQPLCRRQCISSVMQPLIVSGGKALVEMQIRGISWYWSLIKGVRDQPRVLHGAEHSAHETIVVACSQALAKACLKGFSRAEFRRVARSQVAKLGEFGARRPAHVDVYVSEVVTILISVPIAVGKGGAHKDRAGPRLGQMRFGRRRLRNRNVGQKQEKQRNKDVHAGP